jgi:PKD repeat protein
MGLYVLATTEEVTAPQESVSFKATLADGGASGVDTLTAVWDYNGVVWNARYVSYNGTTPEPALVSFNVDFTFAVDARTVTFTNESKDAISYSWDFGDGNTSTEVNPVHTYAADGTYAVKLTGTGATGSKEVSKNVIVDTQTLTTVPAAPTELEANVISIYSDAYTDIAGVNLNPNWGQATVTSEVEVLTGEMVLKMAGLNYQGIDWAGTPQDVSAKTKLHLDIWCPVVTDINVSLISSGAENPVTIATEAGVWKSVDILLSDYTVPDKTATIQIKFDDAGTGTAPTIYVDNIYFY